MKPILTVCLVLIDFYYQTGLLRMIFLQQRKHIEEANMNQIQLIFEDLQRVKVPLLSVMQEKWYPFNT